MHRDAVPHHTVGLAERIYDRGGVHPELHDKCEQNLQIAVFGSQSRDEYTETQCKTGHHYHHQRSQKGVPVKACGTGRVQERIGDIYYREERELDTEPEQVRKDIGDRHGQTREIDLSENIGIIHKGVRGLGETVREILPHTSSGQVEKRPRNSVRRDAGDASENYHVHYHRQRRLYYVPYRTEYGLLVLGDDITLDEKGYEVAILPDLTKVHLEEAVPGLDDSGPLF